jgi:hypothetical protein
VIGFARIALLKQITMALDYRGWLSYRMPFPRENVPYDNEISRITIHSIPVSEARTKMADVLKGDESNRDENKGITNDELRRKERLSQKYGAPFSE